MTLKEYDDNELITKFVAILLKPCEQYRSALAEKYEVVENNVTGSGLASLLKKEMQQKQSMYAGLETCVSRDQFWLMVLVHIIKAINAVGGDELMQGVYQALQAHPEEHPVGTVQSLSTVFHNASVGIGEWHI